MENSINKNQVYSQIDVIQSITKIKYEEFLLNLPPVHLAGFNFNYKEEPKKSSNKSNNSNPFLNQGLEGKNGKITPLDEYSSGFYPYAMIGRLASSLGVCTGSIIGKNLILTAAHCVYSKTDGEAKNLRFQPGYPKTKKWYNVKSIYIPKPWILYGAYYNDIAILEIEETFDTEGNLGVIIGGEAKYGWWSLAYPASSPFNGQILYSDGGPETLEFSNGQLIFNIFGIDHIDYTPGASGCPFMTQPQHKKGKVILEGKNEPNGSSVHYINGLASHMYQKYPGVMISPYFGSDVEYFVKAVLDKINQLKSR